LTETPGSPGSLERGGAKDDSSQLWGPRHTPPGEQKGAQSETRRRKTRHRIQVVNAATEGGGATRRARGAGGGQ
jgi:hypothetical protein